MSALRAVADLPRDGDGEPWMRHMRFRIGKDAIVFDPCVANVVIVLKHSVEWKGVLGFDEMSRQVVVRKSPPWEHKDEETPRQWTDQDDARLGAWFTTHSRWRCTVKSTTAFEGVQVAARDMPFHPVRDYLRGLQWDGVPRLDAWCSKYLGAKDTDYVRTVGRMWLISAVARVMRPGCQADHVLILEGDQGAGKSASLKVLFGGPPWFVDTPLTIGSKDALHALEGRWCVEIAELASFLRADRDAAKAYFTSAVDTYRPAHGRAVLTVPRQCVFAGTVNPGAQGYLDDETGARRYWPVATGRLDLAALAADRDQLWAEVVSEFDDGRPWWPDAGLSAPIAEQQSDRFREDVWQETIFEWTKTPEARRRLEERGGWSTADILGLALGIEVQRRGRAEEGRAGRVMRRLGCSTIQPRESDGQRPRRYVPGWWTAEPGTSEEPEQPIF